MPEARIEETEQGLRPAGPGWFVLNATEAVWHVAPGMGRFVNFEPPDPRFPDLGINVHVLAPGERSAMYHREGAQEDFLVLHGECLLLVEGQERRLRQWDLFHCPPGTGHVFVGAGEVPCAILMVGARGRGADDDLEYPADEVAQRHGAGVAETTTSAEEAYADAPRPTPARFTPGDLV